jgi:hypothetical protein
VMMKITRMIVRLCFLAAIVAAGVCSAESAPTFQLDHDNTRVVSVSNLYADPTCTPRKLSGTVVKRLFEDNRVMVAGFILELPDGSRDFINVDADFTGLTLEASGWIIRGLERMLNHGNVVEVTVKSCAIGHIGNLDAVREVPPSQH